MKGIFRDELHAWNPSTEEIRAWAYSNERIPTQDWELAVNSTENIPMICTFVDDKNCNQTSFFLSSLYVYTGDIVSTGELEEITQLSDLLKKVEKTAKSDELKNWVRRSRNLIQHPNTYNYDYWGLFSKYVYDKTH
ncbi:hypothetical protein M3231_04740 [Neobacillus mesonae]|nr:hypothetical protein [Neobacillus mesonae]